MRFFIKKEFLEEIEGDMEELFYDAVEHTSLQEARRIYTFETLKLLRPVLLKNFRSIPHLNQAPMFKNYFKVSLRGLMKNPVNSVINIFGLAAAIGFCIFSYAFARWTYSTDNFHEHKDKVFLTTYAAVRDGSLQEYGNTPRPLGEMLKQDHAHIEKVCRVELRRAVIKYEDHVFHERVHVADPEFLEMFTFPLKWGTANTLHDINSIVLSDKMATKYFGEENPVGESVTMIFESGLKKVFTVGGVAEAFPPSSSFTFAFIVNLENLRTLDPSYDFQEWNAFVNATFIQVDDPKNISSLHQAMEKYRRLHNEATGQKWPIASFGFEALSTLHERTEHIRDDIARSSETNFVSVILMTVISALLLVLACLNYVNIAIASAAKRLKEIGVRKSIGATRRIVIVQFLSENLVITFFALIFGLILGLIFFIPGFELLWNFNMDFRLDDPRLFVFLVAMMFLTSIVSGFYPSLYISRFQVVSILKGSVKFGHRSPLTKFFLGFQLIMCCLFITSSVYFSQNTTYLFKRGWGYDQDRVMYASVSNLSEYENLTAVMAQLPDVEKMAGSTHHIGKTHATTVLHFPDKDLEVDRLSVDGGYFEALGLTVIEGRGFSDYEGSDTRAVIVNEDFVRTMKKTRDEDVMEKTFRIDSVEYQVIGVVRDFHNYSFRNMVRPMIFTTAPKQEFRFLTMRARPGSEMKIYGLLKERWAKLFPEIPFDGGLQRDVWGFYFEEIEIYGLVWKVIAFLTVSLATLGLYGLVRLNVAGRTKEFSIRKVFGAGMKNLAGTITSHYAALLVVALVVGAPAGLLFSKWLIESSYVYHKPITFSGVVVGIAIMISVVALTFSTQVRKVVRSNAVEGLKTD